MIGDCFPKLEQGHFAHFETIGMQKQNLFVILPQVLDAWNDNWQIIKSKNN